MLLTVYWIIYKTVLQRQNFNIVDFRVNNFNSTLLQLCNQPCEDKWWILFNLRIVWHICYFSWIHSKAYLRLQLTESRQIPIMEWFHTTPIFVFSRFTIIEIKIVREKYVILTPSPTVTLKCLLYLGLPTEC